MHYVEITIDNDSVRTESGVACYWRGDIVMTNPMPTITGMIKSKMTGNKIFRPVYKGTGKIMLMPRFHEFVEIELKNERYVIDRGAYWASDMGIEVDYQMNTLSIGLLSNEGFVQTGVHGTGTVIATSPGPVEIVDLHNERLVLDGATAVARSASLKFTVQKSSKSIIGTVTSGEGLVQVLEGTGRVYMSAVPNHAVALQEVINNGVSSINNNISNLIEVIQKKKK